MGLSDFFYEKVTWAMKYRIDLARKVAKHKIDLFFLAEKGF